MANPFRHSSVLLTSLCSLSLVACSGSGGGGEGGAETGAEGPEGAGAGGTPVVAIPFVSSGLNRGTFRSLVLKADETFGGKLNTTEVALVYDKTNDKFLGRVKNEAGVPVCNVAISVTLDGSQVIDKTISGNQFIIPGLVPAGGQLFELPVNGANFTDWTAAVTSEGCNSAPSAATGGEGAEGGAETGGGESGTESGTEAGGGSGGAEASPPTPLNQSISGTLQNQDFNFSWDASTGAFRGTVTNPTANFICASRTEIHTGRGTQVIELGPTIHQDLAPGATLNVVMSADGFALDTYSLHPEAAVCP